MSIRSARRVGASTGHAPVSPHMPRAVLVAVAALAAGAAASVAALPAPWLLGPLLVALALSLLGRRLRVVPGAYTGAQAVIGVALSLSCTRASITIVGAYWAPVLAVTVAILALSLLSGRALARLSGMDQVTAALGTIPGGASGMIAMSSSLDADTRLVAFMQCIRLVLVVISAPLVARYVLNAHATIAPVHTLAVGATAAFSLTSAVPYALGLLLVVSGVVAGRVGRLPGGAVVVPLLLGAGLGIVGNVRLALPLGLLPVAFAMVGLHVGSLFDRQSLRRVGRLVPAVLAFVAILVGACAALAWVLARVTGMSFLTAYLATSPGGMDSITIAAFGTGANVPVVLAVQMVRFFVMVLAAPPAARWLALRDDSPRPAAAMMGRSDRTATRRSGYTGRKDGPCGIGD